MFRNPTYNLRWLVGLKILKLEQQKVQFPLIILAKKRKTNTLQLEINNLRIQILAAKMT